MLLVYWYFGLGFILTLTLWGRMILELQNHKFVDKLSVSIAFIGLWPVVLTLVILDKIQANNRRKMYRRD